MDSPKDPGLRAARRLNAHFLDRLRLSEDDPLKPLEAPLLAASVLAFFPPIEELERRLEDRRRVLRSREDNPELVPDPEAERSARREVADLERQVDRVRLAHRRLTEAGWTWKPEEREARRAPAGRGQPPYLLTEAAGLLWERIRPAYQEETGDRDQNCTPLRARLARHLRHYYPSLDAEPGGRLDRALRSYLRSRIGADG